MLLWVQLPSCFLSALETVSMIPGWSSAIMVNMIEVFMGLMSSLFASGCRYDIGNRGQWGSGFFCDESSVHPKMDSGFRRNDGGVDSGFRRNDVSVS
jgi:hypothetical protein